MHLHPTLRFSPLTARYLVAIVSWPATWPKGRDSFPLSTYPLFASKKTSPSLTMEYALGFDAKGKQFFIAPRYIGSGEVLQARGLRVLDR